MSSDAVQSYYEEYWRREQASLAADPLAATRLRLLRDKLRREPAASAVDAGCGGGHVVAALVQDGLDVVGLDVSRRAMELATAAHPGCRFIRHAIDEQPWPVRAHSVDLVVSFEVIEHLLRPAALLEAAHVALRPGGRLVLTTPFHGRAKNVALALLHFDRHFAVDGDHIRFFSDRSLRALLEQSGFEVEEVRHFGRVWPLWAGVFVTARAR